MSALHFCHLPSSAINDPQIIPSCSLSPTVPTSPPAFLLPPRSPVEWHLLAHEWYPGAFPRYGLRLTVYLDW
ncbi:hypothetical protein DM02DRAFT_619419 [Periconia macrospinosa]|uniref:Uncharacterized protein n=1 Tax=Periconia macrospinosa TaxID=97972 RepID=A0A2V1D5B3_9PLEO|nr:hypothetical protein DM02DRAFT_619419 [Periconia macrospinosa]